MTAMTTERRAEHLRELAHGIMSEVSRVIVGQTEVIRDTVVALIAGQNVLLEGVPGLGKTQLVRTLSEVLDLTFSRIQFTPDLMPADITGTNVLVEPADGRRGFRFESGPIFAHLVLADEINRATPKDPVGAAGSHAGAAGQRGPGGPRARPAVLRHGHAKPDRDGGHLSVARGPGRPVHVQAGRGLSVQRRAGRDHRPHHRRPGPRRLHRRDGRRPDRHGGSSPGAWPSRRTWSPTWSRWSRPRTRPTPAPMR